MKNEKIYFCDLLPSRAARIAEEALSLERFLCSQLAKHSESSLTSVRKILGALVQSGYLSFSTVSGARIFRNTDKVICAVVSLRDELLEAKLVTRQGEILAELVHRQNPALEYEFGLRQFLARLEEEAAPYLERGHALCVSVICKSRISLSCKKEIGARFPYACVLSEAEYIKEYVGKMCSLTPTLYIRYDGELAAELFLEGAELDVSRLLSKRAPEEETEGALVSLFAECIFRAYRAHAFGAVIISADGCGLGESFSEALTRTVSRVCNLHGDELPQLIFDGNIGIVQSLACRKALSSLAREICEKEEV